jgi:hypothetical protein
VQPARDGFDLMQCEREPDFRRQRIVDADDHDAGARRQFAHHAIVRVETEHGPAAAMQVDQRWLERGCHVRPVQTHAHVALRGCRQEFVGDCHHRATAAPRRADFFGDAPHLDDRQRIGRRVARPGLAPSRKRIGGSADRVRRPAPGHARSPRIGSDRGSCRAFLRWRRRRALPDSMSLQS